MACGFAVGVLKFKAKKIFMIGYRASCKMTDGFSVGKYQNNLLK